MYPKIPPNVNQFDRTTEDNKKKKPLFFRGFWMRLDFIGLKNGGGAGTRTPDTGIMIPLLYQLSYTAPEKSEA
jgi:hypothetical protein